jgi:hypothetical protein
LPVRLVNVIGTESPGCADEGPRTDRPRR